MSAEAQTASAPQLPLRMLTQWVYCPRLFWLMHVEGQMEANAFVWRGRHRHARTDRPGEQAARRRTAPTSEEQPDGGAQPPPEHWRRKTALSLGSERIGLVGKLDGVLLDGSGAAIPTELKSGSGPDPERHGPEGVEQGAWLADAVQVAAQALLLEEAGHQVPGLEIYYSDSRRLVRLALTESLRARTLEAIAAARRTEQAALPPAPLIDSPKCPRCSLAGVCMPEETALLRSGEAVELDDPDAGDPVVRRILSPRLDEASWTITATAASIKKEGDALAVHLPEAIANKLDVPRTQRVALDSLRELCLVGGIQLTAQALWACAEHGVQVTWLTGGGRVKASLQTALGSNVQLRIRQHAVVNTPTDRLAIARALIQGKVRNQRTLLRRNCTELPGTVRTELDRLIGAIDETADISQLMGVEGRAARVYFEQLSQMLAERGGEPFRMSGRNRRPPRDPANALLSFGYSVLTKDLLHIVQRVGFDPMVGFLHSPGWGRPALALDLLEEFRPLVVDSTVLRVIARGSLTPNDFRQEAGGVLLLPAGRRRYLKALAARKDALVTHPLFGYRLSYLRTMEVQARLLARVLSGEADRYVPMTTR